MRSELLNPLFSDVMYIKGVGPGLGRVLGNLGINTARDLLFHAPSSYLDKRKGSNLKTAAPGDFLTVTATVESHHRPASSRRPYKILCRSGSVFFDLVFFRYNAKYPAESFPVGAEITVSGEIERGPSGRVQFVHPVVGKPEDLEKILRIEPQYPLTEGLTNRKLCAIMEKALEKLPPLPEWLPQQLLAAKKWPSWREALLALHMPQKAGEWKKARERLAFDELLAHQLALKAVHRDFIAKSAPPLAGNEEILKRAIAALPFSLTSSQHSALEEIKSDMASGFRMLRLLQGDVGSGKTVVGMLAMLVVATSRAQAAFMAPTSLLAQQQKNWIEKLLAPLGINVALLTGEEKGKERQRILESIARGEAAIVVGTHAVFQEGVSYRNLGLAVIDEQHRFGVNQRLELVRKNESVHALLMTATPIPRSLALACFGEIKISVIPEKPAGRQKVETSVISASRMDEIALSIERAISRDEKIFWICPLVEESDKMALMAAAERHKDFASRFGREKVGLVHGRMTEGEKAEAMRNFSSGPCRLLIATTVIEVGIDIPDATVIFIEHAERFGLSQLHQLRGRVGRGSQKSRCVLLYHPPLGKTAWKRLQIMRESDDGFAIAEADLKLRGSGEMLGTRQSGFTEFRFSDPLEQPDSLALASKAAAKIADFSKYSMLLDLFGHDSSLCVLESG